MDLNENGDIERVRQLGICCGSFRPMSRCTDRYQLGTIYQSLALSMVVLLCHMFLGSTLAGKSGS
jgi:hypothetical protein